MIDRIVAAHNAFEQPNNLVIVTETPTNYHEEPRPIPDDGKTKEQREKDHKEWQDRMNKELPFQYLNATTVEEIQQLRKEVG